MYPNVVEPGGNVVVSYVVENVGDETDDYEIQVTVNGINWTIDKDILLNGTSSTLVHTFKKHEAGLYKVIVKDRISAFVVQDGTLVDISNSKDTHRSLMNIVIVL